MAGSEDLALNIKQGARPLISPLFGVFPGDSVSLLDESDEVLPLAGGLLPVIVSEFAPVGTGRTHQLLPVAFNLIPIHIASLSTTVISVNFIRT
jgi:hypothetical protein